MTDPAPTPPRDGPGPLEFAAPHVSDAMYDAAAAAAAARGAAVLAALLRAGVRHVVLAPGSRSTPLVLAVAAAEAAGADLAVDVCIDERTAAFVALGAARQSGRPAAVITTSGSAIGHALPAAMEAKESGIPLVLVSADRPEDLHGTGANQTTAQQGLFASVAVSTCHVPAAAAAPGTWDARAFTAVQAALEALHVRPGPVHVNVAFDKPLEARANALEVAMAAWAARPAPDVRWETRGADAAVIPDGVRAVLASAQRPVIQVGQVPRAAHAGIRALAARLGAPIVADVTAGLSASDSMAAPPIAPGPTTPAAGLQLANARVVQAAIAAGALPDVLIRVGGHVVTPAWERAYAAAQARGGAWPHVVHIAAPARWFDPAGMVTTRWCVDEPTALDALNRALHAHHAAPPAWCAGWHAAAAAVHAEPSALAAVQVARHVLGTLDARDTLVLASSMAIRHADTAVGAGHTYTGDMGDTGSTGGPRVHASRGTSGIDGLVATARGEAWANAGRTVLVVGDVALAHDVGSLLSLADAPHPVLIVLLDNAGGAIFDLLPAARAIEPAWFKRAFTTPPAVDFAAHARAAGLAVHGVDARETATPGAVETAIDHGLAALARGQSALVHVRTEGARDIALFRAETAASVAKAHAAFEAAALPSTQEPA